MGKRNESKEGLEGTKHEDVQSMFELILGKLDKLNVIDDRVKSVKRELKELRASLEFAHGEIKDLKEENKALKNSDGETRMRLKTLEEQYFILTNRLIDLQARDNLLFYNLGEKEEENVTEVIHNLIESHLKVENAKTIKIDCCHRMGKKRQGRKPRAIVVKFNYFSDKQHILANAKKLKGSGIAISEQFPEKIVNICITKAALSSFKESKS